MRGVHDQGNVGAGADMSRLVDHWLDDIRRYCMDGRTVNEKGEYALAQLAALADNPIRLNVACGDRLWPGWVNADINLHPGTSWLDLRCRPYPYPDNSVHLVMISHALQITVGGDHAVGDVTKVLEEFHRILAPGGWLRVDDSAYRIYDAEVGYRPDGTDFPMELYISRDQFKSLLYTIGFAPVHIFATANVTHVQDDPDVQHALMDNSRGHTSVTFEARKRLED